MQNIVTLNTKATDNWGNRFTVQISPSSSGKMAVWIVGSRGFHLEVLAERKNKNAPLWLNRELKQVWTNPGKVLEEVASL